MYLMACRASYNMRRSMPSVNDFRRMALGCEGAIESAHMGHPDFRANGRIFATIQHDAQWGMVKLTPEQQQRFVGDDSDSFKPAAGAWGAGGSTLVHFASVYIEALGEALTLAWQSTAKTRNVKRKTKKGKR